jgi:hypothetical protein
MTHSDHNQSQFDFIKSKVTEQIDFFRESRTSIGRALSDSE